MKPSIKGIKYVDKIEELVDRENFVNYINYLIDNNITKYLCYADVDNMNDINEKYGSDVGDIVLKAISDCLVRSEIVDCAAHDKSDEFLFSCDDNYEKVFYELVKNIRSNYIKDIDIKVTLSIVVISIDGGENFNNLYDILTLHMPRAKAKGKNCALFCRIEKEVYNGNLVIPHIVCKFCNKRTNINDFANHVLVPDDFLKNRWYRNIKINRCNRCNVAALNLKESFEFNHDVLTSQGYLNILNKDLPDEKKNILLAAIIYESINDYLKAGMLMYLYYNITKKENAINYAIDYFSKDDSFEAKILLLDAFRKSHHRDLSMALNVFYEEFKTGNRYQRLLIELESKYMYSNRDDLSYEESSIGKHMFKNVINDHKNLTDYIEYSGDNIEDLYDIFDIAPEYKLITVLEYQDKIYGIFVIPYLNVAKVRQFDYSNVKEIDHSLANEIIERFKHPKLRNDKYFNDDNIVITDKKYNGRYCSYKIDKFEYDDIFVFYNEHKKELVGSNYYYRPSSRKDYNATPTFISKLHIRKDVREIYLYNYVVNKILYDGSINDWVKIKKEGFDTINSLNLGDEFYYELYLKDDNGDIEFDGNKYKKVEDALIDSEIITKYSFYGMKGIKNIKLQNVKIVEKQVFDKAQIENCYLCEGIKKFDSNLFASNFSKYKDGYYIGNETNKYILLYKYEASNDEFIIHDNCEIIIGYINGKEKIRNAYLANSKIIRIPEKYFEKCELEILSLPITLSFIDYYGFTDATVKRLFYDGTVKDFKNIELNDTGYDPITERPESLDTSPLKKHTDLYLISSDGEFELNGKKYNLH